MRRKNLVWELAFVLAAVAVGVGFSMKPWETYREQRAQRDANVAEQRQAEQRSEELIRQKARLESAVGQEELAREHGYRPAHERPASETP